METLNAIIQSVSLTSDDHGLLSAWIFVKHQNGNQGFGGYALYLPKDFKHHSIESVAGHFIFRCMQIAEVTEWNKMKGKSIRVKCDYSHIESIGHIVEDDWFNPSEDFKYLQD